MTLAERIAEHDWYHALELAPGVVTPGWFDLRGLPERLPFGDLRGLRCLDVGTFDGFWAFHMERAGAAEVVAVDVLDPRRWDWPAGSEEAVVAAIGERKARGAGFALAAEALGSSVRRIEGSVYDLDPEELGRFDLVYIGSLLLHLRDPVRALEAVAGVCRGRVLSLDAFDPWLTLTHPRSPVARLDGLGRPWWNEPNLAHLRRSFLSAGLEVVEGPRPLGMPPGPGHSLHGVRPRASWLRTHQGRRDALTALWGDPHAWTLARTRR